MGNKSILDQIITNQKIEQVANLDAVEIINKLFSGLNDRERAVLTCRFGLHGKGRETLDKIGKEHKLTRERIRQIETSSIKKLNQLENLANYISGLKEVITILLEEHGGIMEQEFLFNNLVNFSVSGKHKPEDKEIHQSCLNFLISKLLHQEFEEVNNSAHLKNSFKLKLQALDYIEELIIELLEKIGEIRSIMATEELISLIKELESYKKYEEKFNTPNTLDVSNILGGDFYDENAELVNQHKVLYSILKAAKRIEQNKFGHWGMPDWREIKPKTINDKIYLILKNYNKPMHFADIADKINQINFDKKKANSATVHNELILDDQYILVGRGMYGLKEWGYQRGTVADVIEDILKESGAPLTRDEIIKKVLEKRLVKKATVVLALMDKDRFERVESNKYVINSK